MENWFKEKPAQYFSLVLLVSVLNFGVVFVVFSVVSLSATTFIYFRCYPAMSAKIFDMKDSASESLGAFAEPLLAKQVPSYPLLLSYPLLDKYIGTQLPTSRQAGTQLVTSRQTVYSATHF